MIPVILSGGAGTRLWPSSRSLFPKQFFPFSGNNTLLQETYMRLKGSVADNPPFVICNQNHQHMVNEQLNKLDEQKATIILEPFAKNTAPAIALAAFAAIEDTESDPILLILPADHIIADKSIFASALIIAEQAAEKGHLVTFGIVPDKPNTGYGYIKTSKIEPFGQIEEFIEKPCQEKAASFIQNGNYFWNSGIFVLKANIYLSELEKFSPEIFSSCKESYRKSKRTPNTIHIDPHKFKQCKEDSIDYAVMEKTNKGVVVPMDAGWSDIGSWSALWDISTKDDNGNVLKGDVFITESENNFVQNDKKLITLVGVDDLIVVESDDAILVSSKFDCQNVKELVSQLKNRKRKEIECHRKVFRPWGNFDSLALGNRYQVKHITVSRGQKLSLQKHHHRAEHWIVVKGTALVTRGKEKLLLTENESTYIAIGVEHRLENPGNIPLEIIEVQSGSYLGEDDIVRIDDSYGRITQ